MKEDEIRPQRIFDEYLRLCTQDSITYFESAARTAIACPACSHLGSPAFTKNGFVYESCGLCDTLYVSPRPSASAFEEYYKTAPSSKYWAETFYKETADARRRLLWVPKARLIDTRLKELDAANSTIVDVGGGYGLFAEEMRRLANTEIVVIEPAPHLAKVCREKSLMVVEKFLEQVETMDLPQKAKAFVSFELFEHLHDPMAFLRHIQKLMSRKDLFLFTTLSGTGLDIQLLWEHSKAVSPPHHLNFFNPRSVAMLISRAGLELVEVSTPGKLDMDICMNGRSLISDRFWRTFFERSSEGERANWQRVIASSGWSSHMMVICRKP